MTDATAGGDTVTAKATFAPGEAVVEMLPYVGQTVLYFPAAGEDLAGGHRGFPAIVVSVDGPAPDYGLSLAVVDLSAAMRARTRPISFETWEAAGADHRVAHWRFIGAQ
jgi:hypothetical protein